MSSSPPANAPPAPRDFRTLELVTTLPGVPCHAANGFVALEERRDRQPNGVEVRFMHMQKRLDARGLRPALPR